MNNVQAYFDICDQVFGKNDWSINSKDSETNNVIGALACPSNYQDFKNNFIARLKRLNERYKSHESYSSLLTQVKEIANPKNWQGAFSELTAYDFFTTSSDDFLIKAPSLNVDIDIAHSLASKFSLKQANLDIHFTEFDTYSDVKCFKDNARELLENIFNELFNKSDPVPFIKAENILDIGYEEIQQRRQNLKLFLANHIKSKPSYVDCSSIINDLRVRIDWNRTFLATESSYSPYKHAESYSNLPLIHAKKFLIDRPFFLTFVIFPWFSSNISIFQDSNKVLYRALSRRCFMQYRHSSEKFNEFNGKFQGGETIYEVSKYLSGLLFLEDNSIKSQNPNDTNINAFYFANPNCRNPIPCRMGDFISNHTKGRYDNFVFDNY